ncbi:MAG: helix-turn-helix transcriptional regulator [Chloroflexi bacterium]|nr:helix-turn-helix transcriptional regulator [Chloroflexota bacterium]
MARAYNQMCPVARTLDVLGDRWTLLVVRDLFLGRTRFKQFLETSPGLPAKVLSDRLKKLEANGLVERAVYSQYPLRAEYRLTEKGRSLKPVLEAIGRWGMEHLREPEAREQIASRVFADSPDAG